MRSPATNLRDAFNRLDPQHPVRVNEVDDLFVLRPHSESDKLCTALRVADKPTKLLFVGHRGSGKSSELSFVAQQLQDEFFPVVVPLYDIFRTSGVTHAEVIFAMNVRLLRLAASREVTEQGLISSLYVEFVEPGLRWFRQTLFSEAVPGAAPYKTDAEISAAIKLGVGEIETKVGVQAAGNAELRERMVARIGEMVQHIESLSHRLRTVLNKPVLILVEDLDKFDLEDSLKLFFMHARTLTLPSVHILYSFQIATRYTPSFRQISQNFDGVYCLHNIATAHRDGRPDGDGVRTMRDILLRRTQEGLFEPGVIDRLIELSGGHVKTLIQLAKLSVLEALTKKCATVAADHVVDPEIRLRNDFRSLLSRDDLEVLRHFRDDPRKDIEDVDKQKQDLLFSGALLEYCNGTGLWGGVNPLVLDLLERP